VNTVQLLSRLAPSEPCKGAGHAPTRSVQDAGKVRFSWRTQPAISFLHFSGLRSANRQVAHPEKIGSLAIYQTSSVAISIFNMRETFRLWISFAVVPFA